MRVELHNLCNCYINTNSRLPVMAALCKSVLKFSALNKSLNCNVFGVLVNQRRFLRRDPEEEIDLLFISESFEQRISRLKKAPTDFKNVGRANVNKTLPNVDAESRLKVSSSPNLLGEVEPISKEAVVQDEYFYDNSSNQAVKVLHHYNIFHDLFQGSLMFTPDPNLQFKVAYSLDNDDVLPVVKGNKISPCLSAEPPLVGFAGNSNKYYSLLCLNLDGHLSKSKVNAEYLHWSCGK